MPTGFIQLFTAGNSYNIFNKDPQITFFKAIYRRYTNFYIDTYELENNKIILDNKNKNRVCTWEIPKNGDLLSKTYMSFNIKDYYFELFKLYPTLNSTLNTNILDFYDAYYTKINTFDPYSIKNISIIKVSYINSSTNTTLFQILSSNQQNFVNLQSSINASNLSLQTDTDKIFYNINEQINFYGYQKNVNTNINILTENIVNYLINEYDFQTLNNLRINYNNSNIVFSIYNQNSQLLQNIYDTLISSNVNAIRLDPNHLYMSKTNLITNVELQNILSNSINDAISLTLNIYDNKVKIKIIEIVDDITSRIENLIQGAIKTRNYVYVEFLGQNIINLYVMKDTVFFGNYINNDFNDQLISYGTSIASTTNNCSNTLPIRLLTNLIVSLGCYNVPVSIQNYLTVSKTNNNITEYYSEHLDEFNNKILEIIVNPNSIILSNNVFYSILYEKSVRTYYNKLVYIRPFINRVISSNATIIINNYLYSTLINYFNSKYNNTYEQNIFMITELINSIKNTSLNSNASTSSSLSKQELINYNYNNNLFDNVSTLTYNTYNIIKENNNITINIVKNLSLNYLFEIIVASFNVLKNINGFKTSRLIYQSNGITTNMIQQTMFPLSSNIYVYSNNNKNDCNLEQEYSDSNNTIFNTNNKTFIKKIKSLILEKFVNDYYDYNYNFANKLNLLDNLLTDDASVKMTTSVDEYYKTSIKNNRLFNNRIVLNYLNANKTIDYSQIYNFLPIIDLNDYITKNIFTLVDNNLFNNSFSNYEYIKRTNLCSDITTSFIDEKVYQQFIFLVAAPIYKIYYIFTLLSYISIKYINHENLEILEEINKLRDFTLLFILNYIEYYNGLNINNIADKLFKFNFSMVFNSKYNLINNFICYDDINIFENDEFSKILYNSSSSTYYYLYNSFYFIQKKQTTYPNILETINENIKYNYDDLIILLYFNTLELNNNTFSNVINIPELIRLMLNKNDFNVDNIMDVIYNTIDIIKPQIQDQFIYGCLYTINMLNSSFDNNDVKNVNTINDIFNNTTLYNFYTFYKNSYIIKSYNTKQFVNYLDNKNIIDPFINVYNELYSIFFNNNLLGQAFYNNAINNIETYITINKTFLYVYIINENTFKNCVETITEYILLFNEKNNAHIKTIDTYLLKKKFNKYNVITIYLYFLYFIKECLIIDIELYNDIISSTTSIYNNFNEYIIRKYTENIYYTTINDIINILNSKNNIIMLDYSTIFYYTLINTDINNTLLDFTYNTNQGVIQNDVNYPIITTLSTTNTKLRTNLENTFSNVQVSENSQILISSGKFYSLYYDQIINQTSNIKKILFNMISNYTLSQIIDINILTTKTLSENYYIREDNYYATSINIINNIYDNLYLSYNQLRTSNIVNKYSDNITKNLLKLVNEFYNTTNNYYSTMYYDKIYTNSSLTTYDNLQIYYTEYLNGNILKSMIYEKEMNRFIYALCTNELLNSKSIPYNTIDYLKTHTLYDICKVFRYTNKNTKKYLENTSLYQDRPIFELINYENLQDNISLIQNTYFNKILTLIPETALEPNSYLSLFNEFNKYCQDYCTLINKFTLSNNQTVLNYFSDIENYDEMNNYIYNYVCLYDYYCPKHIFESIIDLENNFEINTKLMINTDDIKKKIVIFLFIVYVILKFIPVLLAEELDIEFNDDLYVEYKIFDSYQNVSVKRIIRKYNGILKKIILNVYDLKPNSDKIQNNFIDDNEIIGNLTSGAIYNFNYLIQRINNDMQIGNDYIIFVDNYINTYYAKIGDNNIVSSNLTSLALKFNKTISYDTDQLNPNKYAITLYSTNLINIVLQSEIYDLNDNYNNKVNTISNFDKTKELYFNKTKIGDYNLTLNLICNLLKYYNITYESLNSDINISLGNMMLGTNTINESLELFKGYASDLDISFNLAPSKTTTLNNRFGQISLRIDNIKYLSQIVNNTKTLSIVTPSDYDITVGFIDMSNIYPTFFQKYYLYDYNYNKFDRNYTVIYKNIHEYTTDILNIKNSLKIVNNYSNKIYNNLFDLIENSEIAVEYYNNVNNKNPDTYISVFNKIIKIYFSNNYTYRYVKNVKNLETQNYFQKISSNPQFTNYTTMNAFLIQYYYYQLFGELYDLISIQNIINNVNEKTYKIDLLIFFENILNKDNVQMIYKSTLYNLVFKFEIMIELLLKLQENVNTSQNSNSIINTNINSSIKSIKTNIKEDLINEITNTMIEYFTNTKNINNFINTKNVDNMLYNNTHNICGIIDASINKKEIVRLFSYLIKDLIYYQNAYSYKDNFTIAYDKYFKNLVIRYYTYYNNTYMIETTIFQSNDIYALFYNYISQALQNNIDVLIKNIYVPFTTLFPVLPIKIVKSLDIKTTITNMFLIITNQNWSLINNPLLNIKLLFMNYYYAVINAISNKEIYLYNKNQLYNLNILYRIIIKQSIAEHINLQSYDTLMSQVLTYNNYYIYMGERIQIFNLIDKTSITKFFDYINSNIINNNIIQNYYKNIQNNTVKDAIIYDIPNYINNENNYDNFMLEIYNNVINRLEISKENNASYQMFPNVIINLLNNYKSQVYYYDNISTRYITGVYNSIISSLNIKLDIFKNIFGYGGNTIIQNINLFNRTNYQSDTQVITIFTILFNEFSKINQITNINLYATNSMFIILFYYSCLTTWTTGLEQEFYYALETILYTLSNLINKCINGYYENIDFGFGIINRFFDGMYELLRTQQNDNEFINQCNIYFNNIIEMFNIAIRPNIISNIANKDIETYNGRKLAPIVSELYNYKMTSRYLYTKNKIHSWKNMLGLIIDWNDSEFTKTLKSLAISATQNEFMDYIQELNGGIASNDGIIRLIESIKVYYDDQQIDEYNKSMYKIYLNYMVNLNKKKGLDSMLGTNNQQNITNGIKPFIKQYLNTELMIPLPFYFFENMNAIPLIACMYTQIRIEANLSNNILKSSYIINNISQSQINPKLICDFVCVEQDERKRICSNYIDNLIEQHKFYSRNQNVAQAIEIQDTLKSDIIDLRYDFELNNMTKQIFWSFDIILDGYTFENSYTPELVNNTITNYNIYNPITNISDYIVNIVFLINGSRRDGIEELNINEGDTYIDITNKINFYNNNTRAYKENTLNGENSGPKLYTYSFGLDPEQFQPTGAINMSKIDKYSIIVYIDRNKLNKNLQNLQNLYNVNNINIKMNLNTIGYNMLRYQSGLSALLYPYEFDNH